MRIQIYLRDGREINFVAEKFEVNRGAISGEVRSLTWTPRLGAPNLKYITIEEITSIVTYPDSTDGGGVQDERDGEETEAGGQQVDPG